MEFSFTLPSDWIVIVSCLAGATISTIFLRLLSYMCSKTSSLPEWEVAYNNWYKANKSWGVTWSHNRFYVVNKRWIPEKVWQCLPSPDDRGKVPSNNHELLYISYAEGIAAVREGFRKSHSATA